MPDVQHKQSIDCKTGSLRKMDETDETVSGECICMLGLILVSDDQQPNQKPREAARCGEISKELVKGVG